jgi:hypothetical protein
MDVCLSSDAMTTATVHAGSSGNEPSDELGHNQFLLVFIMYHNIRVVDK